MKESILEYLSPVEICSIAETGLENTLEKMLCNPIMDGSMNESEVNKNE